MIAAIRRNTEASLLVLALAILAGGYWLASIAREQVHAPTIVGYSLLFGVMYLAAHIAVRRLAPSADPLFLPVAAMLNAVGLVVISRLGQSSRDLEQLAAAQARWLIVGVAGFISVLLVVRDVRILARYRYTWAALGIFLILLPILPAIGQEVNGARLWIRIGPLNFQPAELGKIALVLFFAGYLTERREVLAIATRRLGPLRVPALRHFGPVLLAWGISLLVMIQEKDLGSSLLFFTVFVGMLWIATGRAVYAMAGTGLFLLGAWGAYSMFGHVAARIDTWLDPFATIDGSGYQLVQSLFALATGGAWGTGLGLGRPDLIPNVATDFIFSAIGEELGLAGAAAILTGYAIFSARGFGLAARLSDDFAKLLVAGLAVTFSIQSIIIIGGVTRLVPLTGITMPFMSYGGSSLLSNFILAALLVRASDQAARQESEGPPTELTRPAGGGR